MNLDAGTIRIENNAVRVLGRPLEGPPKTKAGRRSMTLPPSVTDDLGAHRDRQPGCKYVFGPSGERPLLADDWRTHPWRRAVLAAELTPAASPRPQAHWRRSARLAGVDPSEIARLAGHSSIAFTYDRYGHLFPEIDKQAAQKLERVRSSSRDCP